MYWSFASWRTTVVHPDSPYKDILEAEVQKRTEHLQERINELEMRLARDPVIQAFERFHKTVESQAARHTPQRPEERAEVQRPERHVQKGGQRGR